ncbi:MAG: hypothetical protein FJX72_05875, partial [Armatimonadetes bacterium]|nr:hypothetical protein [Armatimonadota bacterium]
MHLLIEQLLKDAPVVLDGAWGTQLQRRGLPIGAPPDPWNLDRPELVAEVARGYVSCGARIILTNTFGANAVLLDRHGLADRVHEINRAGARISVREAGEGVCVFGSIGPTGKMVSMGEATRDDLERVFAQQVAGLVAGGVHGLVVETMSDIP